MASLARAAKEKGVDLLGTGDFQHPRWLCELERALCEDEGILRTEEGFPFVLQTELSLVYKKRGKCRRVHNVVLASSFDVAKQVQEYLKSKGRIDYDGRPILKIHCDELVEELRSISRDIEIIPAHAWTPWYSVFGSKSGFDSLKEAFEDQERHIHAIETGLSSDPEMNSKIGFLKGKALVSSSDAHSAKNIGREATVFDIKKLTYKSLIRAIRNDRIVETIEYHPESGKYHFDGHRACNVRLSPKESKRLGGKCPKCKRGVTVGVASRVEELSCREKWKTKHFKHIIPLREIISKSLCIGEETKTAKIHYEKLIARFGSEFAVHKASREELLKYAPKPLANAIKSKVKWSPGYDGRYGEPKFQ